jgi:outer membrane biosynthesis protein TonB
MSQNRAQTTTRIRISAATLTGDKRSPAGWIGSLALHGAIVVATLFTWTHRLDIADESSPIVPVDLVTIAHKTNVMPSARPQPRIKPDQPVAPPAPPAPEQPKEQPPSLPQQEAEAPTPTPEKVKAEPIAKPPPPVETTAAEPIKAPPPPPAPPKAKPKQTPAPDKKNFDVDNVLALLNKVAPPPSAATNARTATRTVKGIGAETAMTADLQDALRSQIQSCWSPPAGAPNPEQLVVSFDLFLNSDGSVAQPPQLAADSAAAAARDPYVRAAAEAARRAIYTCAPYKLPADRYSQWREINPFIFDPRQMLGQ